MKDKSLTFENQFYLQNKNEHFAVKKVKCLQNLPK